MLAGLTNAEIAREMGITRQTLECHAALIRSKYGVRNHRELLIVLVREQSE